MVGDVRGRLYPTPGTGSGNEGDPAEGGRKEEDGEEETKTRKQVDIIPFWCF